MSVASLIVLVSCAVATAAGTGRWISNSAVDATTGVLEVTSKTVKVGREISYRIALVGNFGHGQLLKVTGRNRAIDPYGCGRAQLVSYIILEPLPSPVPVMPEGLKVTFYGGGDPPRIEALPNDRAVCEVVPFRPASGKVN